MIKESEDYNGKKSFNRNRAFFNWGNNDSVPSIINSIIENLVGIFLGVLILIGALFAPFYLMTLNKNKNETNKNDQESNENNKNTSDGGTFFGGDFGGGDGASGGG